MLQVTFPHKPRELFEAYSPQDIYNYLWEMYQSWLLEIARRDHDSTEISNRMYFFELLCAQLSSQFDSVDPQPNPILGEKVHALCKALELLIQPRAIFRKYLHETEELYILLPNLLPDQHQEIEGTLKLLTTHSSEFRLYPIAESYLSRQLEESNPYFWKEIAHSTPLYQAPDFTPLPSLDPKVLQKIKQKALARLDEGMGKAMEFFSLFQDSSSDLRVFFLHQALELSLRTILLAWENLEKKTHETRVLVRLAAKYIPHLFEICASETQMEYLRHLDKSYVQSRYGTPLPSQTYPFQELLELGQKILDWCHQERRHFMPD